MGLGKTVTLIALHLHRRDARPPPGRRWWSARPPCSATGRRRSGGSRPASPSAASTAASGRSRARADRRRARPASCSPRTAPCARDAGDPGRRSAWDLVVADEAQHVKNARVRHRPGAAHDPARGPGRAHRHPGREQPDRALGDPRLGDPGPARQPQRLPQGVGRRRSSPGSSRPRPRQFAGLIGPFLLRRRKSDPGIAPELPAKTETDHPLGLTREQVVLYESFVRDTMDRIERADEETRRGLVLELLTGLKQICNHPAHFLKQSGGRLTGPLGEARPARRAARHRRSPRTARCWSSPSTSRWPGCSRTTCPGPASPTSSSTAARRSGEREAMVARFQAGEAEAAGLPALAQGRRHRPQPHPRRPRRPLRPLVEPRRRGPGHRPGLPDRPDPRRSRCTGWSPEGTIEERIAELLAPQARAGRLGARPAARPRSPS